MNRGVLWLAAWSALVLGPVDCRAEAPAVERLQKFVATDFYKQLLTNLLSALPPAVYQHCPALQSNGSHVTILTSLSFGPNGFPTAGAWKQAFPVSGCGNDTVLNFYFAGREGEKISTIVGAPGATIADLVLQRDAQRYALIGAGRLAKDCEKFDVVNTRFEAYGLKDPETVDPGRDDPLRPWWETWTVAGCGRTFDVQLDFAPDKTGTQIIQPDSGLNERQPRP
jgi:hypothetical protein